MRPSAPAKKSISSACWPILACMSLTFGPGFPLLRRRQNTSVALSSNCVSPLRDLVRVHVELLGQFGQGLVALQCGHGHLRLECRRMIPSRSSHCCSPFAGVSAAHKSRFFTYLPVLFCRATSGEPIQVLGVRHPPAATDSSTSCDSAGGNHGRRSQGGGYGGHTDLDALNKVGMWIALSFERQRLMRSGLAGAKTFDPSISGPQQDALVFDVSTPDVIAQARTQSTFFDSSMRRLNTDFGISLEWPGFDLLTLDPRDPGNVDRMIELKSSGIASRVQAMSWNEWKTAGSSVLRSHYYLYLVGNLRSDLIDAVPFIRIIRNPFEQLVADVRADTVVSRKVQLAVDLFKEAQHLELSILSRIATA